MFEEGDSDEVKARKIQEFLDTVEESEEQRKREREAEFEPGAPSLNSLASTKLGSGFRGFELMFLWDLGWIGDLGLDEVPPENPTHNFKFYSAKNPYGGTDVVAMVDHNNKQCWVYMWETEKFHTVSSMNKFNQPEMMDYDSFFFDASVQTYLEPFVYEPISRTKAISLIIAKGRFDRATDEVCQGDRYRDRLNQGDDWTFRLYQVFGIRVFEKKESQ